MTPEQITLVAIVWVIQIVIRVRANDKALSNGN